jgi:hypothetical protein
MSIWTLGAKVLKRTKVVATMVPDKVYRLLFRNPRYFNIALDGPEGGNLNVTGGEHLPMNDTAWDLMNQHGINNLEIILVVI